MNGRGSQPARRLLLGRTSYCQQACISIQFNSMRFAVVKLRREGAKIGKEELAESVPLVGDLEISDWPKGNSAKRILRKAELMERTASWKRGLLRPLFDPVIIRMTERWFVLRGYEINSDQTGTREYMQEWLVRPVTPEIEEQARLAVEAERQLRKAREG